MLKIPKSFKIFEQTISVVWEEELLNNANAVGQAQYRYNTIALQPSTVGKPRTHEQIMSNFWHEVFHFIFFYLGDYTIGKIKLRREERLLDMLGLVMHQILVSSEGDISS